jgi:phosphoglycolate phosphatase
LSRSFENISTIIFDFDGTIADTLKLGVSVSNSICDRFGYKKISNKKELDIYRNLSTQKAIKAVGISYLKLPIIAHAFRKELAKNIDLLKPIDGIPEVIRELAKSYKLGIVTSNSQANIESFLTRHGMTECFHYFSSGIRLFQKNKTIKSIIKKGNLKKDEVLLVGDETRDIEAASSCGLPIISATWGFHTRAVLEEFHPDEIIDHPSELLQLLINTRT